MKWASKNITFFICSMSSGGAEHQLSILSNLLVARGYNITITTFGDNDDHYSINSSIKRVRLAEKRSKCVKFLAIFWYFLTIKTDVIISYGQRENFFALLPLCFRKVRFIASERSFSIKKQNIKERLLHKLLYRRADVIVPNSHSQGVYIKQCSPHLANRVVVVTNYTDLEHFAYVGPPCNDVLRIGVFGRYNEAKNYQRLIRAVYILKQQRQYEFQIDCYGNHHFKGDLMNENYLEYQRMVDELRVGDVIHLNDHVQNVAELMPMFDAICLPSLYEGWSNSISEAICCGKPMLVSDVSDNKYMVHDGENGFLFNPESIDDIVCAFNKFFQLNAVQRVTMGRKSREIAEQLFNEDEFVDKYIQLIEY
ncbi:MAG: glycosyltransferase [Alistipes sp.]|nr:glycosyltransferase [Alistipes sp.]